MRGMRAPLLVWREGQGRVERPFFDQRGYWSRNLPDGQTRGASSPSQRIAIFCSASFISGGLAHVASTHYTPCHLLIWLLDCDTFVFKAFLKRLSRSGWS